MNFDRSATRYFVRQWHRMSQVSGWLVLCAVPLGSLASTQATAPVVQLRGTIKDISSEGRKLNGESPFELNVTEEKYSLRVIETAGFALKVPAGRYLPTGSARYHVSNLHDIFSSSEAAKTSEPKNPPLHPGSMNAVFQHGSLPSDDSTAPRAKVLAYAHLAMRLPKDGKGDAEFAEQVTPALVVAAAKLETSDFQTQVVRKKDGSLERVNFWGLRSVTDLKVFENTRDAFLLASLVVQTGVGTMPVAGVFTVFGKRPGLLGKLVSFERQRFEFSGEIGTATQEEAFGWLTYYREQPQKKFAVFDIRFLEEDGPKGRIYVLSRSDELPFAKEKTPASILISPSKPSRDEPPSGTKKSGP